MKVIVSEKPSVARDIARVLKVSTKKPGYFEGNGYRVTWAFGHLVRLLDPDEYSPELGKWRYQDLPIIPETFKIGTSKDSGATAQFETIKQLITAPDVNSVICATDAGREGELIFRLIYLLSGCDKPIERLWISSQTDDAIKDGFATLRPGHDYDTLYDCAKSRSEADWIVGINATRAYTIRFAKGQGVMSVGRVQTPVLKMIVDRHLANTSFEAQAYYEIEAKIKHQNGRFSGLWIGPDGETRIHDSARAQSICDALTDIKSGNVQSVLVKEKREYPPLLYDLTELQKDANRKFKLSADRTLAIAQSLYETHKLITYPRTSSRYLSSDLVPKLPKVVASMTGWSEGLDPLLTGIKAQPLAITKRMVDDEKITDHHAIIPTGQSIHKSRLSDDEIKIFDLIIRRVTAALLPECKKETTEIVCAFGTHRTKTSGIVTLDLGWRSAYESDDDDDSDSALPKVNQADSVSGTGFKVLTKKTKAPPLHTEASILAAMETAGRQIEDDDMREAMKECGLGTPATRAQILERLIAVKYITRVKNRLIPTEKGIQLISVIQDKELISPELTGEWEKKLNQIRSGKLTRTAYMSEIAEMAKRMIGNVQQADVRPVLGTCPKCGGDIGETPKAYSCRNWKSTGCKFAIWKEMAGVTITAELAAALLRDQITPTVSGFKAKSGKLFDAKLAIRDGAVIMTF